MELCLKALTWDNVRGYGPARPTAEAFARTEAGRGVRIDWTVQLLSGFESGSVMDAANQYDVLIIDHPHVIEAASAGAIVPVDLNDDEGFVGPCESSYRWQGQPWAVPVDAASHVAAWRADGVEPLPATWHEAFEQARYGVRFGMPLRGVHALMALLTLAASMDVAFDSQLAEEQAGAGFPNGDALAAALVALKQIGSICIPDSFAWDPIEALQALVAGACDCVPMTFGYAHFQNQGVRFGRVPAVDCNRSARPILGGTGMAVSARRPHIKTALAFAGFAGSRPVQTQIWPQNGGQPAHREAWRRLGEADPFYRDTLSSMTNAYVRPRCIGWNQFQSAAGEALSNWLSTRSGSATSLVEQLHELWREATRPNGSVVPDGRCEADGQVSEMDLSGAWSGSAVVNGSTLG